MCTILDETHEICLQHGMAAALTHCRTELNCLQIDVLIHYTPTENLLLYAGEHACEKAGYIS